MPLKTGLKLLKLGYWVVAIKPGQKRPIGTAWGTERWTEERLRAAIDKHPEAGIGICFGPGRAPGELWLIDIEGDGPEAADSKHRLLGGEETNTPTWESTRGAHELFVADGERLLKALGEAGARKGGQSGVWHLPQFPGLELRVGGTDADGSIKQLQSVCPPTLGTDGKPRAWLVSPRTKVERLPEAAYEALEAIGRELTPKTEQPPRGGTDIERRAIAYIGTIEPAISGKNGHDKLFGAVCRVGPGFDLSEDETFRLINTHYSPHCVPPWSEAELRHKVQDAYQEETRRGFLRDAERNGRHKPGTNGTVEPKPALPAKLTIGLDEVVEEDVDWIYENVIAIGFISIFAGQTSQGKSFVVCDLIARLTRGDELPFSKDKRSPCRVLMISEDPLEQMLGPRLNSMGAVKESVRFLTWEAMATYTLTDTDMLDQAYLECSEPILLVIDPPQNFLGKADEHKNSEVRTVLMRVVAWLQKRLAACILIMHVNKQIGKGLAALDRIMGSVAWATTPRIAIGFTDDPDNQDQHIMAGIKNNLGRKAQACTYRIVTTTPKRAKVEWGSVIDISADDAMNKVKRKPVGHSAVEWITDRFREQREWESLELKRLAREAGISTDSIFKGSEVNALPILKRPRVNASGDRYWVWIAQPGWPKKRGESSESSESTNASPSESKTSILSDDPKSEPKVNEKPKVRNFRIRRPSES